MPALAAAHTAGDPVRGRCRGECGRLGHGLHDATCDPDLIRQWWRARPGANIGVACEPAGLVVLDLDTADPDGERPGRVLREQRASEATPADVVDAVSCLRWLARRRGGTAASLRTLTVGTPSGGRHLYFRAPPSVRVTSGAGMESGLGWLLDVRAAGGYVVVPPSQLPSGGYTAISRAPMKPLPVWLWEALADVGRVPGARRVEPIPTSPLTRALVGVPGRLQRYLIGAVDGELQQVQQARPGTRNDTLNRAAFSLASVFAGAGCFEQVRASLTEALVMVATMTGLGDREALRTVESGLAAGARSPRSVMA